MDGAKLLPAITAASALWLCHCADRVAGGSEIGNPGSVAGAAVDSAGLARGGVALRLLPRDYDPMASGSAGDTLRTVTDALGRYLFSRVPAGSYVLTGVDPANGFRFLAGVEAGGGGGKVEAGADTLRTPGRVVVETGDSAAPGTYLYLPGTLYRARVDAAGRAVLDSVPSGAVRVVRSEGIPGNRRLDTVEVPEGGAALAFHAGAPAVGRAFRVSPGEGLQAAADSLAPGDTLYLRGGVHYLERFLIARKGKAGARIAIRNQPGEVPVLRGTSGSHNLVTFAGAEYVDLEGLEIDSTFPGSDAVKFEDSDTSHHVSIRNLHIHHVRGIAINGQGGHHHIALEGNHIHHTRGDPGSGIRVADNAGTSAPSHWSVQGNWIHHCGFEEPVGSAAVNVAPGARDIVVRDNVVHDNAYAGILVFGRIGENPEGEGLSLVEGNAIWNSGEAIGAYADVTVRNNVVFDCTTQFLSMRYQGAAAGRKAPENVRVHNNSFHGGGDLAILDWDSSRTCVFANNAVYGTAAPWEIRGTGSLYGNVGDRAHSGFAPGTAAADLADPRGRMFRPRAGSALIGKALGPLTAETDFEGRARDGEPDVGAYEYRGAGAGGPVREGFKGP